MNNTIKSLAIALFLIVTAASSLQAGTIIVDNDEWTLSDVGFTNAPGDTEQYVKNIASIFAPEAGGSFHAYSTNFSFNGVRLKETLESDGHHYSASMDFPFTLENISGFDGLFMASPFLNDEGIQVLKEYVYNDGNVYVAAGTRFGGAEREAESWNRFLTEFGLRLLPVYNGIHGNIDVSSSDSPLFDGVGVLYQNNGSSIAGEGVLVSQDEQGLYAMVYVPPRAVPVPSAFFLLASGLVGLAYYRFRVRKGA